MKKKIFKNKYNCLSGIDIAYICDSLEGKMKKKLVLTLARLRNILELVVLIWIVLVLCVLDKLDVGDTACAIY